MFADPPSFDGERAYGYLKKIVDIGPHTAGSEANTRVRKLVADHFTKAGAKVREQPFKAVHPTTGQTLMMANLIASWKPEIPRRVVIGAHYDTRPHADEEVLPEHHNLPFVGANDPGSGIAVLMEMANHLTDLDTDWGVDLVLFDGEELVFGNNPRVGEYFLGSEEFARVYAEQRDLRRSKNALWGRDRTRHGRRSQSQDQAGAQQLGRGSAAGSPGLGRREVAAHQLVPSRDGSRGHGRPPRLDSRPASQPSI